MSKVLAHFELVFTVYLFVFFTGWVGSVLLFSQGIASLPGVYLFRFFGFRRVMFTSAVLAALSFFSTPHMPNLEYIFLTYSIPFGIACGFHECTTVVSLREYFSKYLGLTTGIRYAGQACGPMIFSYLIPIIFDIAGWNKMMTCFSSLGLMFAILAMSYQPLPNVEDADASAVMVRSKQEQKLQIDVLQETKTLLKDKRILMMLCGNVLFSVVEYIPNMFMIQYTRSLGYPLSKSKWLLVTFSLSSIVSRSVFGYVADYFAKLNKMRVLLSAVIILFGVFSTFCSFTQSLILMTVYMGAIGILDGIYWVVLSFAAMEISDIQHFDIMFTLMLFVNAFGYLIGPPALGWLYDATGNFSQVLYVVGACAVTAGIFILAGALLKPTKSELYNKMGKSVIETSEVKKCSLVVFERETVI